MLGKVINQGKKRVGREKSVGWKNEGMEAREVRKGSKEEKGRREE